MKTRLEYAEEEIEGEDAIGESAKEREEVVERLKVDEKKGETC